jgi:Zn-dependent peptidase ImmA (M78 family)
MDFFASPISDYEIAELAATARTLCEVKREDWAPDLVKVLMEKLPSLFDGFECDIVADDNLPGADARATFTKRRGKHLPYRILIKRSVFARLEREDGRSRFTVAHELGHLWMHPGDVRNRMTEVQSRPDFISPSVSGERQANRFATGFLMPGWHVRQCANPAELECRCKVSEEAARIAFADLEKTKERQLPAEGAQNINELKAYNRSLYQKKKAIVYSTELCTGCGQATLVPIGVKYLCSTCDRVSDQFQDGDKSGI